MASHFPLLSLPPELRNWIYELVHAHQMEYEDIHITNGSIVLHPLTRTCQQLRVECSPIFRPTDLSVTEAITAQVFDFDIDQLHQLLLSWPRLDQTVRLLHITIQLTAPGAEDMPALRRWLSGCRDSISQEHDPLHAYDRHYHAKIDWTNHDMNSASSIVQPLTRY